MAALDRSASVEPTRDEAQFARRCGRRPDGDAETAAAEIFLRRGRLALFEQITALPEYYPTRSELAHPARACAGDIAALLPAGLRR